MRTVALTASVILALVATATPVAAQFRGSLTSRPSIPSAGPRSPLVSLHSLPIWWNPGSVWLPEGSTLEPPIGEQAPKGGVQLDMQPWSAQVYVDGKLAGRVEEFRGYYRHLELPAGPHVIGVVADGRDPLIIVVMVVPGRVVTQRATLAPAGLYAP
jgi:hypothetical protein